MNTQLEIISHGQDADGRTVLALRGEVDLATAPRLRATIMRHLARRESLVLDVTGAMLIDASGLRALNAARRYATDLGTAPIVLRGVRPLLAKTLRLTGLDHLFPREPALAPALVHPALATPRSSYPANQSERSRKAARIDHGGKRDGRADRLMAGRPCHSPTV